MICLFRFFFNFEKVFVNYRFDYCFWSDCSDFFLREVWSRLSVFFVWHLLFYTYSLIFSTFRRTSFRVNFKVLLWYFCHTDFSHRGLSSARSAFLCCGPFSSHEAPFSCHPLGLLSHLVLPSWPFGFTLCLFCVC